MSISIIPSRKKQSNFSREDDARLAQCFLAVSQDVIRAGNQTSDQFWSRIKDSFNTYHNPKISKKSLQNK